MYSTSTRLSDISEVSSYTSFSTVSPSPALTRVPFIDIEPVDETPFSESFSERFDYFTDLSFTGARPPNDVSYDVDRITDIQGVDSDWDDDDIDEIVVISRKAKSRSNPRIRERKRLLDNIFSLSEFEFITQPAPEFDQARTKEITSGTYLVKLKRDTNQVYYALKAFRATPSLNWPFELRLLEMLTEQGCPFLPSILRRVFEHQSLFVLLDFYPAGTMLDYVLHHGKLDPDEVLFYTSEITEAISVLHDVGIEHRDINPSNVMFGADGHIVLTGFDFTRVSGGDPPVESGDNPQKLKSSPPLCQREYEYRAPEVLLRWEHDSLVDCWGLGCLMYFMTFGKHPFPLAGLKQVQVYKHVLRGGSLTVVTGGRRMDPVALDLILKCLERNPQLRLNIEEIKRHGYFSSIDWSAIRKKKTGAPHIPHTRFDSCKTSYLNPPDLEAQPEILNDESSPDIRTKWSPSKCHGSVKAQSIYSLQARHHIQDLLPNIFRSPSLDELKMKANQARVNKGVEPEEDITTNAGASMNANAKTKANVATKSESDSSPGFCDLDSSLNLNHDLHSNLDLDLNWELMPDIEEDRAPSYESLRRSPAIIINGREVCSPGVLGARFLSPSFWDSLDREKEMGARTADSKPARVLGIGIGNMSGGIQISSFDSRFRQNFSYHHQQKLLRIRTATPGTGLGLDIGLRRQRSSLFVQKVSNKFSQFVQSNRLLTLGVGDGGRGGGMPNKLRKLRRPKSTPAFAAHPDVIMKSGTKEGEYELPNGLKQIGNGIGFTYRAQDGKGKEKKNMAKAKATVKPEGAMKASIASLVGSGPASSSRSVIPGGSIGIGLGFGLETRPVSFGDRAALLGERSARRLTSSSNPQDGSSFNAGMPARKMRIDSAKDKEVLPGGVDSEVDSETMAEAQDIFQYGSTWSLMPDPGDIDYSYSRSFDQVSPGTATDSTAYSPLSEP